MNCLKKKLFFSMTLGVGLSSGLSAMENNQKPENEKGILSSVGDMLFSKSGLAVTGATGLGLGWLSATDDQKKEAKKMGKEALDYASHHKMPVVAGGIALGAVAYLGHKYLTVTTEKSAEKQITSGTTEEIKTGASKDGEEQENLKPLVIVAQQSDSELNPAIDSGVVLVPVPNTNLLPPSFVNFTDLVIHPLYKGEEQAHEEEIKELCELFLIKPYALFFNRDFLVRLSKGSAEVQESFSKAIVDVYQGSMYNLFLNEVTVIDIQERFNVAELRPTVMPLFYFIAETMQGTGPLGDHQFMVALREKELISRVALFSFLTVLGNIYHDGYKQDFIIMMNDAGRDDLVLKYSTADFQDIKMLLNDEEVINQEGCVEWLTDAIAHLGMFNQAVRNFFDNDLRPYLPEQS